MATESVYVKARRASISTVLGTCLAVAAATQTAAQSVARTDSVYLSLRSRVASGDTTIDFHAFRVAYATAACYDPMSEHRVELRQRLYSALAAGNRSLAAVRADSLLLDNYTDINAHVIRANLAIDVKDSSRAQHHAAVARGLMRSLDLANRGASTANPLLIVDPDEESVFGMMSGLERTQKYSTAPCGDRVCDSTVFHDPKTSRDTTIVFDVTLIFDRVLRRKP